MLTAATKPKKCIACGAIFTPPRAMARACIVPCALLIGRAKTEKAQASKAKVERAEHREKLKAVRETIPKLIAAAQTEFNTWVRARDEKQPCISCGKPPPDLSGLHAGRDAGHYRSTGAAPHLRFHEDNCHAQCVHCNQHRAGNAVDYRIGLIQRIGVARVEALEADNEPLKWDRDTLRQIKTIYRAKARQLKKDHS